MKLDKANKRDKKRNKKKNGMRVSGKSVFLIQEILIKKGEDAKNDSGSCLDYPSGPAPDVIKD